MASKVPEEPCNNSETEAETIALRIKKKRSRRVSFADTEITSVHIFNRDEDYDTPPDSSKPTPSPLNNAAAQPENEVVGFFRDLGGGDSDDFKDSDDDEEDDDGRKSFLRPIRSPSPGSSVPGSATSNDEDSFFGPVSAHFIRPGRLSDSAASDDIHEATLDTTAFSMHYRSLARSDSGGDLKTPTAVRLAFEEKMPTHNTNPTDSGSLMSLTKPKKLIPQSLEPVDKVRGGEESNDMSIIEENPHKYDYGRLSPTLNALLAEGSKNLNADSVTAPINVMPSKGDEVSALHENGIGHMDLRNGRSSENSGTHGMSTEAASVSRIKLSEANGSYLRQIAYDVSSNRSHHQDTGDSIDGKIQTPNQLIKVNKEFTNVAFVRGMEKLELTTVNGDTLPNVDRKALQFDVYAQHEPAYEHSSQGLVKEHSPKERRYNFNSDQHSDQQYGSPMEEGSISLLSARRHQSILNTPTPSRHSGMVTPSLKQPGSFLSKGDTKHSEWVSSIQKSISRFTIPEPSPCASSLKEGIDKLKSRLSSYSSMNSPLKTVLDDISKDCRFSNSPTLEKQLAIADLENRGQKSLFDKDSVENENPVNISFPGQIQETADLAKDEESLHYMFTDTLSKDKMAKPVKAVASPSQLSSSGNKMTQHHLMSENPSEGTLVSSGTDSVLADEREDNLLHLQIESEKNFQSPSRGAGILNFQLGSPDKYFQAGPEPPQSKSYVFRSTTETSLQSPSSKESAQNPSINGPTQSPAMKEPTPSPLWRKTTQSPLRKEPSQSPCRKEPTQSPPRRELTQSPIKELIQIPFVKEPIQSPIVKEPILSLITKEQIRSPSRKEPRQSPSRLDSSYAALTENMQPFVGRDMVSSVSNSNRHRNDDCCQGLHILQSPFSEQDAENSFGRKRRNLGTILEDGDCTDKIHRSKRSSKVHRSGNYSPEFMLDQSNKLHNDREKLGSDSTRKCWTDILAKFSGDSEQLLSPSTSKLNLRAIGVLEDILVHLLKAKKYEALCSQIRSQKVNCTSVGHKRVAEARLLLYKLVLEKAKLQLLRVRRDRLQSRVQLVSSAIQECQMLKLNYIHCQSEPGKRETTVHRQSCLVNSEGEQEVSCDKVSTMRQELEALEREIQSLRNFFHTYSKLKGEPSCADTVALVHDHLKTRTFCRFIRQDLQLWDVDDFEIENGHYNILLRYHGYISQRFTGTVGPASNIVISIKLNDIKITKDFPNIDAQVAFAFVLNAEVTKKSVDSRCLAQETQVTRSLLCNLLDVVEEVQLARIEIVNLIQTSFHTPSAEQLDLQLCFLNLMSGRKVTVTLDVTCLSSGVYPSDILPYQKQASVSAAEELLPQSLLAEIRAAAHSLQSGYMRIMRLCKCISHIV